MWPFRKNMEKVYLCWPYDLGERLSGAIDFRTGPY